MAGYFAPPRNTDINSIHTFYYDQVFTGFSKARVAVNLIGQT